jgi:large subunit ribosomal protein L29
LAILKIKQVRELKPEDILKKLSELKLDLAKELGNVRMGRPVKNPGRIRELKKAIARLETVRSEIRLKPKVEKVVEKKEKKKESKK